MFVDLEFDWAGLGLYLSENILGCANQHDRTDVLEGETPSHRESPVSVLTEAATWCLGISGGVGNIGHTGTASLSDGGAGELFVSKLHWFEGITRSLDSFPHNWRISKVLWST